MKDYLFVSLYFLFIFLANQLTGFDQSREVPIFKEYNTFFFLSDFFLVLVVMRIKWADPPKYVKIGAGSLLIIAVLNLFVPPTLFIGVWWVGQYYFNPINLIVMLFTVWCIWSTRETFAGNRRVKLARYIWVITSLLFALQNIVVIYFALVLQYSINNTPFYVIIFLITNGQLFSWPILFMHIFLPEAVLISQEQIFRVKKLYKHVLTPKNAIAKLGINKINQYLELAVQLKPQEN